jgi:hypothetical protein
MCYIVEIMTNSPPNALPPSGALFFAADFKGLG